MLPAFARHAELLALELLHSASSVRCVQLALPSEHETYGGARLERAISCSFALLEPRLPLVAMLSPPYTPLQVQGNYLPGIVALLL